MKTYTAVCERVGGWWEITVPELDGRMTQARRLDQVDDTVRSLVSLIADVPSDSFEVAIRPTLPEPVREEVRQAAELRTEADRAAEAASKATRKAARDLAAIGLTVRDIGSALRLTPQRVSQLLSGGSSTTKTAKATATARAGARPTREAPSL
jgi:pyruvate/2-oxoglutarate dehydrogenase complex dihydrolipoamide acyltransferase (E2) component